MRILLSMILLVPMCINAQNGIRFEESLTWNQALQKAKNENKYIFVDCYATWCGPCKWMESSIYSLGKVGDYFNKNFIALKVQMDTSKLDNDFVKQWYGDASMMKSKYKIMAFPTYLFFSPKGDIVHKDVGAKRFDEFMIVGAEALNSDQQFYTQLSKYHRDVLDASYMKSLARKVKKIESEELGQEIANNYINRLPSDSLFTKDNIQFMAEFTKGSNDRGFEMFRDSSRRICEIDERFDTIMCKNIVLSIINNEEIKPYSTTKKGKPDWDKIKSNLKKYLALGDEAFIKYKPVVVYKAEIEPALKKNSDWKIILPLIRNKKLGRSAEYVVGSTIIYYLNGLNVTHTENDCRNLIAAATYYADSFSAFINADALNTWAYTIFLNSDDKDELSAALNWSKRSNDLESTSPESMDTYANLLYKLGRVKEAIVWQAKAVKLEETKSKRTDLRETFEKMQKGEKTWP